MVKEWNLLRTIACLTVVLLHSSTLIGREIGYPQLDSYHIFRIILCFATPTFIVLSEIILSNKYQSNIPNNFFKRRVKLIFGPFITFAIVDALVVNYLSTNGINIGEKVFNNFLGRYEGYFILIIFQFYILHYLIIRFKISVKKILPISIIIMVIHLSVLNSNISFINEYKQYFNLLFTAWFGYFTVAFLIGKYYESIARFLKSYRWVTLLLVCFAIYLISMSFNAGIAAVDSKRIDIFPLSIAISLAIIAWGQSIPNFKIIDLISNYSLGIYLIHWQVQTLVAPYIASVFNSTAFGIIGLFLISLILSMSIIKIISLLPFGKYMVGNTKRKYKKTQAKSNVLKKETA